MVTSIPGAKLSRKSANWCPREETSTEACGSRLASSPDETSSGAVKSSLPASGAAARNHVGFIVEPEAAVLLQHPVGSFEVPAVADHLRQPDILDLRDIDGGIPGRKQRRGSDRA